MSPPPARPSAPAKPPVDDRLYLVTYDIADPKRWRSLFRIMNGYGDWLQLSVFQCRLSRQRRVELQAAIEEVIHRTQDHVLIFDIGPTDTVSPKVTSLGKSFAAVERRPVIV